MQAKGATTKMRIIFWIFSMTNSQIQPKWKDGENDFRYAMKFYVYAYKANASQSGINTMVKDTVISSRFAKGNRNVLRACSVRCKQNYRNTTDGQ